MRIPVDYIVGERKQSQRALQKVFKEIFSRISSDLDWHAIDFHSPFYRLKDARVRFAFGLNYASSEILLPIAVASKRRKGSIYHIHNQKLGSLLHSVSLKPSVLTCHDIIEYVRPEYNVNPIIRQYIKWYHSGAMKADRLIVPSEFTKRDVMEHFKYPGSRIEVVHNGIDRTQFRPREGRGFLKDRSLPLDRKYILFVGSEQPRKNVDVLVRAFLLASKRVDGLTLLKVGAADEIPGFPVRAKLIKMLEEAGASNRVIILEDLSDEELASVYNSVDALVFPSAYEGFGLPPLEAMASGVPVITSNVTSIPEVVGDAALMLDPNDAEKLADAMVSLLDDRGRQQELVARGLERSKMFSWDESARKVLGIYERMVGS